MDSIDLFSVKSEITLSTNDFKHFIVLNTLIIFYQKNDLLHNTMAYFL